MPWPQSGDISLPERLELNQKTVIFPLKNGIDFIGFHTYLTETGRGCSKN